MERKTQKRGKRIIKQVIALRKVKKKALKARERRAIKTEKVISPRHEADLTGPVAFAILQMEGDILSTAIYTFDYDPSTLTLQIQFWKIRVKNKRVVSRRPGNVYMYFQVPSSIHDNLIRASSKGRYFYYNI
ncbi:MAG: KTSC domain-containing protein, partial [Candidatus Hodarchaeales archaeon]